MAVTKRANGWIAEVYAGKKNNKSIKKYGPLRKRKSDAIADELMLKKEVIESAHIVADQYAFSEFSKTWSGLRKNNVSARTWRDGEYIIGKRLIPFFGTTGLEKITKLKVAQFVSELSGKYSAETVLKTMSILNQIMDFALECNCIQSNPCSGIKKPQVKRQKREVWSPEEISRFLNDELVKNQSCYFAFLMIFTTGMRPGEVCGLRWCDWQDDHVIPTCGIDRYHNTTTLKNSKAHDSVYISDQVQCHLKKMKIVQRELYFALGKNFTDDCFINVLLPDMRSITPDYLRKQFNRIVEKRGYKKIRLYDARHSFGTNLMRAGVNPKEVAEAMRHTTVKTTLDVYSHVDEDEKKAVMNNYARKLIGR